MGNGQWSHAEGVDDQGGDGDGLDESDIELIRRIQKRNALNSNH